MPQDPLELTPYDAGGQEGARGPTPVDWLGLLLRAARRRWWLAGLVFLAGVGAAVLYYSRRTPMYRVEAKILMQRAQALPSVVRTTFEDAPGRSAWELIHRRENLIAIIEQAKLLEGAPPPRTEPSKLRALLARGGPSETQAQSPRDARLDRLVLYLDRNLLVSAEEGTVTLGLDWPDPLQAYTVVQATLENFIAARYQQEVTAIEEVIAILEGHTNTARKELELVQESTRRHRPARVAHGAAPLRQPNDELVRLRSQLESKRRAVQDVEELRRRRLAELLAQLDQARNTYSEAHPVVTELRQQVDAFQRESPQLLALRREELELARTYADRLARDGGDPAAGMAAIGSGAPDQEDQGVRDARMQYEQMNARLSAAQLELDAARSAFKYRYKVIWPPQVPREPFSPNPKKILGAGVLASLLMALFAAAAPDLLRGRIVERWQVERSLDLRVLGEIRLRR
jgi:uncharacterized protein involved in exopolysaccharide biosynthesis